MPDVEGPTVPEGDGEGCAPTPSPTTTSHVTLFVLNDGGEKVAPPPRADAVTRGVAMAAISQGVGLCRALRSDEEDLAQWVARDADG